jgi:FtsZ-binding cell division protein ZapB
LKNKLISSQNDYKGLLQKFETFANLNCELSTKIEQLESSAPSTATDDGLIKKNEKLKAKLASSQEAIENFLGKIEILSIHNNELTTKLENIGSTPEVSLVEIPEIIKKDASTSCFDLIDDSNLCNQAIIKNVIIETCSDEIAMENEQLKQEVARLGKTLYDNVTPGFKGYSRVHLKCAPKKNITYNDKVYRYKCHKYHYYIAEVLQK